MDKLFGQQCHNGGFLTPVPSATQRPVGYFETAAVALKNLILKVVRLILSFFGWQGGESPTPATPVSAPATPPPPPRDPRSFSGQELCRLFRERQPPAVQQMVYRQISGNAPSFWERVGMLSKKDQEIRGEEMVARDPELLRPFV